MWHHLLFALVAFFVGTPLILLVLGSFSTATLPTEFNLSTMGLINYIKVYSDPLTYELTTNTAIYVGGSVVVGIGFAAVLAWLVDRTNVPCKLLIYAGVPMVMAIPSMLQAMAWILMLSPRIGFFNTWLKALLGLQTSPINIYSLGRPDQAGPARRNAGEPEHRA